MAPAKNHLYLKKRCNQQWNSMGEINSEKFCQKCSMQVSDLTQKSNAQIIQLVLSSKGRVCGRVRQDQIDKILVEQSSNKSLIGALSLFLLSLTVVPTTKAKSLSTFDQVQTLSKFDKGTLKEVVIQKKSQLDSTIAIKGRVIDQDSRETIPGVQIILKGTSVSSQTDVDGNFEIEIPEHLLKSNNGTLVFSFIGFEPKELKISDLESNDTEIEMSLAVCVLGGLHIPLHKRIWWKLISPFKKG